MIMKKPRVLPPLVGVTMCNNLTQLQKEAYEMARIHGWHDKKVTPGEMIALMHSELSEALEEIRNGHEVTEIYMNVGSDKPEGVPIELADCVIRILDFCGRYGIDLNYAVALKMIYNDSRPYRHGGKKL
jgi:NTP pyrophosphatase (non-canonical NTP hydrolase)